MSITQEQFDKLDESFIKDPSAGTKSEELYLLKLFFTRMRLLMSNQIQTHTY